METDMEPLGRAETPNENPSRDVSYVDTYVLTRTGHEVSGQTPISSFERLIEDLPEQPASQVSWSVKGEIDPHGRHFLRLSVQAVPVLECQRCLQPLPWPVDAENRLRIVKSEADLDDEGSQDTEAEDMVERIVGSPRLDVLELVEDEIILGLPYVPKHDVCPSLPEALAAQEPEPDEAKPSPFAVLDQLKKD